MNCPNCQQTLEENARFCIACGLIFIGAATRGNNVAETAATVVKTDPLLGRTLDAKYELLARLGQGGMGTVYRARRVHIGDEVAVKVLHQHYSIEADVVARFRREAQAAATLRHPNVVAIYDYSEMRGAAMAYIVMELVPGVPLGQLLKNGNRLPLERAVALMSHICAGVGAAHRRQIVHRDLKPDNIIVTPPSRDNETEAVKVVDFGIAKLRDLAATQALTQTGMIIGTPFYMSPEQCRGDELDARSDVYSLGVMFYEMIAGLRPFNAPTPTGVIAKHLTQAPPPLHATLKIPSAVEAVLMRALAKDPQARQADATALAFELENALQQTNANTRKNIQAVNHVVPSFTPKAQSHNVLAATLAVFTLICLIAGASALYPLLPRRSAPAPQSQAVQQQTQPAASQTPSRPATSTKIVTVGKTKTPAVEARPSIVKAQPSIAVVSHPLPAPRTVPPPTRIGPSKAQAKSRQEFKEFFAAAPTLKQVPVTRPSRRAQPSETNEQMPPEVRRIMQQMMQGAITTRQSDGKVTTIYVTRPGN